MDIVETLLKNFIYLLFPIILYFILLTRDKNILNNKRIYSLELAVITSMYLLLRLQQNNYSYYSILLLNIPLIICLKYNKNIFAVVLSVFLVLYYHYQFDFNIIILIINYLLVNIICIKNNSIIKIDIILSLFNLIIIYLKYNSILTSLILVLTFVIIVILTILIIDFIDNTLIMNCSFNDIEKEKKIEQSLFQITHEIKNPLTVCKGYAQMSNNVNDLNKMKQYMNIINEELEHTLLILDDFKSLRNIDVKMEKMNLCALLDDIVDCFNIVLINKNIDINYTLDNDIYIYGDYERLKQVFLNVIKNSLEALVDVKDARVNIDVKIKRKYVYVNILDNGIGIDKNDIDKIFDSFYTTKSKGTGLGLYICREIIVKHGGSISYESKVNEYTKCIIKLKKVV